MAIDSFLYFQDYQSEYLKFESRVQLDSGTGENPELFKPFKAAFDAKGRDGRTGLAEVEDYSFDIEQVLNIGSQSSGAGAGKVTFNPFSITRKIDCASADYFQKACSGTPFKSVGLGLRKSAGGNTSGIFFVVFTFRLVAVKTISWAHDDESPKETITFEYGGLHVMYSQQAPDGKALTIDAGGWNRVKNIAAQDVNGPAFNIT